MITKERLEAIRKRAGNATEGPWVDVDGEYINDSDGYTFAECERWEDARFIAHAREDVPALLEEVERLQAESTYWRMEHDHQRAQAEMFLEKYKKAMAEIEEIELQRKADGEFLGGDSE